MAIFLNRLGILKHFDRLFVEAKRELVLITPYIKLSDEILEKFELARKRGIEILLVYKEDEKSKSEIQKLKTFDNLTILKHSHLHSKCYLNENSLIICSMNLYEHSIKNNREMGVLMDLVPGDSNEDWEDFDEGDDTDYYDFFGFDSEEMDKALEEINEIIKASDIVHKSVYAQKEGFKFEILKTSAIRLEECVAYVNQHTDNKKYKAIDGDNGKEIICQNYIENCDLKLELDFEFNKKDLHFYSLRRIEIRLNHPTSQINVIREKFGTKKDLERKYKYFKVYWPGKNSIYVYRDHQEYPQIWNKASAIDGLKGLEKGCKLVIQDLKKIKEFVKIF